MNNKFEVKKYIRIPWSGELGIITKILKDGWAMWKPVGYTYSKRIKLLKDDNILISENILDLISDRDILEVELLENGKESGKKQLITVGQVLSMEAIRKDLEHGIYEIKRILTKEQFIENSLDLSR